METEFLTPSGWLLTSFESAIDFQEGPGILAKDFRPSGVPLIRLSGLDRGAGVLNGCDYLDELDVERRWSHFRVSEGDVLLSTSASLGRVAIVDRPGVGAIPYTGIIRMRPRSQALLLEFIPFLLRAPYFQTQVEAMGAGSVIRHFGPTHLRQMNVLIPPTTTQHSIARVLGSLDDKIELNRRMNETLEAMARALFKSWFVDFDPVRAKAAGRRPSGMDEETAKLFPSEFVGSELGEIPKGWRATTLGKEVERRGGAVQTGPFGSQLHASDYVAEGIPVVMPKDISNRRVTTTSIARTDESNAQRLARHRLQENDIVYSRRGDVERHALIGPREVGWLCGTGCLLVRLGPGWLSSVFASFALDQPETRAWITQHAIGATMPNLNTGILEAVPLVMPSDDVLRAFARAVDPLQARTVACDAESSTLAQLRDALLPRLLAGEITVANTKSSESSPP